MKIKVKIMVVILSSLLATSDSCDYKKFSEDHSYCKDANDNCDLHDPEVTDADKKLILKEHNKYREKIATGKESRAGGLPEASNMMEMVWDEELASIAQSWADQCEFRHDCSECRRVDRFPVGQNIYIISSTGDAQPINWESVTEGFYEEVKNFDKSYIKPFKSSANYGHFTQIAWGTTWRIGCGIAVYTEGSENKSLAVCNYGPAGNIDGDEMYKEGKPCSECPKGTCCSNRCKQSGVTSDYQGLCKAIDENKFKIDATE